MKEKVWSTEGKTPVEKG